MSSLIAIVVFVLVLAAVAAVILIFRLLEICPPNEVLIFSGRVRKVGRKRWKRESRYHRRSLAETTMFRLKTIFGRRLSARTFDNQAVELFIKCAALNRMIQMAKPDSFKVEV